jgi:membrane protein DedA with SNARE-associated domain
VSFLTGLHGGVALLLFCSLLFAEEAGVPLPFAPGEAVLIAAGILIANGALVPWLFIPLACLSVLGGTLTGYVWARAIGSDAIYALAGRVGATKSLERVSGRVRDARPYAISVSRLIPGLRVYTTLVAGAVGVNLRTFFEGVTPAVIVWVIFFTLLGALVGLPAEHVLGQVGRLALDGAVLLVIAVAASLALLRVRRARIPANDLMQTPRFERVLLALAIDAGIVASLVSGAASLLRATLGLGAQDDFIDAILVALVVLATALLYMLISRRGFGGTGGEAILNIRYHARGSDASGS